MGKVSYSPGIEFVQGSLAKPKKQNGHNHGDYLIGTHRTAPTTNPNCTRIYIRKGDAYVRTSEPSNKELAARNRFAAVQASVNDRKNNLTTFASDQAAFVAQMNTAGGKKTFLSYLWKVCGDAYDAQNS